MGYTQVTGCLGRGDGKEESRRLAGLSEEGASGLQRAEKVQKIICRPPGKMGFAKSGYLERERS